MNIPFPRSSHRDDVEPSSAAALIESTYDYPSRPSRRLRAEISPSNDPLANDPGSVTHVASDDVVRADRNRPVEDIEGVLSRKSGPKKASSPMRASIRERSRKPTRR